VDPDQPGCGQDTGHSEGNPGSYGADAGKDDRFPSGLSKRFDPGTDHPAPCPGRWRGSRFQMEQRQRSRTRQWAGRRTGAGSRVSPVELNHLSLPVPHEGREAETSAKRVPKAEFGNQRSLLLRLLSVLIGIHLWF